MIPATILARMTIWIWAGYAIWQGQGIIWDGPIRFGGPSFAVLRAAPYPTLFWGWSLTVSGMLMLGGSLMQSTYRPRVQLLGLIMKGAGAFGVAVWSVVLAVGAFAAAQAIPTNPGTGGRTYAAIAAAVLVLIFIDERKRDPDGGRSQTYSSRPEIVATDLQSPVRDGTVQTPYVTR